MPDICASSANFRSPKLTCHTFRTLFCTGGLLSLSLLSYQLHLPTLYYNLHQPPSYLLPLSVSKLVGVVCRRIDILSPPPPRQHSTPGIDCPLPFPRPPVPPVTSPYLRYAPRINLHSLSAPPSIVRTPRAPPIRSRLQSRTSIVHQPNKQSALTAGEPGGFARLFSVRIALLSVP